MIKVIETNLSLEYDDNIIDHQLRVIQVENWKDYINEIKESKTVIRNSVLGCMYGYSIPRESEIKNLKYDDNHLSCDVYNWFGRKTKKLAYKV